MSQRKARTILCAGFFFFLVVLIYTAYMSSLSFAFIICSVIGAFIAFLVILLAKKGLNSDRKSHDQALQWVIPAPFIGVVITGVVRSVGNNDLNMLFLCVGAAATTTLLGWIVFFFKPAPMINPQDQMFSRSTQYRYEDEEREWKETLWKKKQEDAEWRKKRWGK